MSWIEWYDSLAKPSWTPAPSTIRLIWMILYPVIFASFGRFGPSGKNMSMTVCWEAVSSQLPIRAADDLHPPSRW